MIVLRKPLKRRTFLTGAGAALALPLLDAMIPALKASTSTVASPVRRLGFVYIPNGVAMNHTGINYWKPSGTGTNFEFSPILKSLEPFRDRMVVVSGLTHAQAQSMGDGNGDHTRGTATWLSGVHPKFTEGSDVRAGTTVDQMAAEVLGKETPIPSLELAVDPNFMRGSCDNGYSCAYINTISWRNPTTPLPMENNPRVIFERLFGDGGTQAQRMAQMRRNRSILDSVGEDMTRLLKRLGVNDRARADEYFDAVREVERRIQKSEEKTATESDASPVMEQAPSEAPGHFGEHVKLIYDLQCLAFQSDLTRVFTFMYGRETGTRIYPEIGVMEGHHAMSHHGEKPENIAKYARVNAYHTELLKYFVEKLQSTPEGDGNLLDHSLILFGSGLSNGNIHSHYDLPLLVVGGATGDLKGGRHLAYPQDTPMTNLLASMLDKVGVRPEKIGDSSGPLETTKTLTEF